ncbi:DUF1573 domain-containing protein [Patescibacteria group bacterium]|nr:DUF1573 domain-containing protein [Patescibacteria group bacterium]
MNKKVIIVILIIAFALVGLVMWSYSRVGESTQVQLNTPSQLTVSETLYDFGALSMANGKVDHLFHITNPTDKDISINNIQTSCMCTTAYFVNGTSKDGPFGMPGMGGSTAANETIPAHGTKDVDVVYDPAAHGPAGVGNIDRFIYISQTNGGTLQLEIKAVVTP